MVLLQSPDGDAQQRSLARARAGYEVECAHAVGVEMRTVVLRHLVVGAQHILLDAYGTRLAHPRHRNARRTGTKVQVAGARIDHRSLG